MNKKNIILASILGLLLVFAYIYQGPLKDWQNSKDKSDNFFKKINLDDINTIEITRNNNTTKLNRKDEGSENEKVVKWKINDAKDFFAKENIKNEIIDKLKELKTVDIELASKNKDNKSEFLTDSSGTQVKLFNGENLLIEFTIGKMADYTSSYISRNDTDETYLIKSDLASIFSRDNWYDLNIFTMEAEKINKIRFQYPDREFTIEKKDGKWSGIIPTKFETKEEAVKGVLDTVSSLQAVKIPAQTFDGTGLEKNLIIVQITGENIDKTIMIGNKDSGGNYYAKRGDSDNIYLIKEKDKQILDKKISDFK